MKIIKIVTLFSMLFFIPLAQAKPIFGGNIIDGNTIYFESPDWVSYVYLKKNNAEEQLKFVCHLDGIREQKNLEPIYVKPLVGFKPDTPLGKLSLENNENIKYFSWPLIAVAGQAIIEVTSYLGPSGSIQCKTVE